MNEQLLLVDYENVQEVDLSRLDDGFRVVIFVGVNQKSIPIELVVSTQALGGRVEWLRVDGNGSNALDFFIACYLGRVLEQSPKTKCTILSRDRGFDPLLRYLNKVGMRCRRVNSLVELSPGSAAPVPRDAPDRQRIVAAPAQQERPDRQRGAAAPAQHHRPDRQRGAAPVQPDAQDRQRGATAPVLPDSPDRQRDAMAPVQPDSLDRQRDAVASTQPDVPDSQSAVAASVQPDVPDCQCDAAMPMQPDAPDSQDVVAAPVQQDTADSQCDAVAPVPPDAPSYQRVVELLGKSAKKSRPRKRKTLSQAISAMFQKNIAQPEVDRIIDVLLTNRMISETNGAISYEF